MSQSFSPGDHKTPPRQRFSTRQNSSSILWEGAASPTGPPQDPEGSLTSQESVEEEDGGGEEERDV